MDPAEFRGLASTWPVCNSLCQAGGAGRWPPLSHLISVLAQRASCLVFSANALDSTAACSAHPSLFQLQNPRDRIDVTSHCSSDGAHSPRASHVTCEPGAGIPGTGPVAPPKVPVRGTRRRLSTCSRKGGSADRLPGLTSPALDSGFSLTRGRNLSAAPPLPRIGGRHVGFDWIRALGRVLELEKQQKNPLWTFFLFP